MATLEAMHLAEVAWHKVDTTTIWNCWCKVGIIPDALYKPAMTSTPSVPVSSLLNSEPIEGADHVEMDVSDLLNQLEELGILQKRNQMDLEELLNPVSEQELVGEISDEEFQSIVDMHEAEKMMEVNGGYDVDDEVVNKRPMCKEALTATFTLKSYVADINELGILASFG